MSSTISLFEESQFSWAEGLGPSRNQFVSFERRFSSPDGLTVVLHLFADTRFRLWVNGGFVAYGPARFVTGHPEYDSFDLAELLVKGENTVRVEVNYYGSSSFQTMPDGLPGFIAAGGAEDGSIDFRTPGDWKALIHQSWDAEAPSFSFAQNPVEICDTVILARELATPAKHPVVALPAASTPWAKPTPRSAPYPDYQLFKPVRTLACGPLFKRLAWGMQIIRPAISNPDAPAKRPRLNFSTWIHSSRDQDVILECFWVDLRINGNAVSISYPNNLGDHGEAKISLHSGWNFLAGNFEIILDHWPFMLGLPFGSETSLHALPDLKCQETFAVSPFSESAEVTVTAPPSPREYILPVGWKLVRNDIPHITPARFTGWDSPVSAETKYDIPAERFPEIATVMAAAALWSFDFGDEYYGQPTIEVEAPAGSILDIAYDDWKRDDGCVALYRSNFVVDAVDRFILQGGRQRIEVVNPRGGIYLQVILRAPVGTESASLTLHDLAIRRRTTINTIDGSFSCGDPVIDWAWKTSVHTLQAATDEAYSDCPWRERGSYIGDTLVNVHLHRLATSDLSVARRTVTVMGQAQREDGQLAGCAPAWLRGAGSDFTLLWIQAVRDIWSFTGDRDFLLAQWPVIMRIWNSPTWKADATGLWDLTRMNVFLDWGIIESERTGPGNCTINVLRVAAARACAELAGSLGLAEEKLRFDIEVEEVSASLKENLWNSEEGRFNASFGATTPALHGNILALRNMVGPAPELLAYLEPKLRENFLIGTGDKKSGHAELYFLFYVFPALAAHGRFELAELMIRQHYGFLKDLGYPTLTECFHNAALQQGSCCHSWSGAPAIYATEFILGLRQAESGNPDIYLLDPAPSSHAQAEGSVPHRCGPVQVKWHRAGDRIRAHAIVPKEVSLRAAGHVDLTVATS